MDSNIHLLYCPRTASIEPSLFSLLSCSLAFIAFIYVNNIITVALFAPCGRCKYSLYIHSIAFKVSFSSCFNYKNYTVIMQFTCEQRNFKLNFTWISKLVHWYDWNMYSGRNRVFFNNSLGKEDPYVLVTKSAEYSFPDLKNPALGRIDFSKWLVVTLLLKDCNYHSLGLKKMVDVTN